MKKLIILITLCSFTLFGCTNNSSKEQTKTAKSTLFIGIDVSGSFTRTKIFSDGIKFLSEYIYAHINGLGGLYQPTDLYVGGIGGNQKKDPRPFFPIHDFLGLKPAQIEKKLLKEFGKARDNLTDFNTYFERVATIVKQKNLVLAPINIVLLTDGVPEIAGKNNNAVAQGYSKIDVSALEYLSRNVSLRILYAKPKVGDNWRRYVKTQRIRIWTVEPEVMRGWNDQKRRLGKEALWKWIKDNVDLQIKAKGL